MPWCLFWPFYSLFGIQNQEHGLNILPVYALQQEQEQEQEQTGEPKTGQVAAFDTPPSFFYPVAHNLLNVSSVSSSSKNHEIVTDNSKEVLALPNRLTLKEYPVPLGSRPHDVAPSLSDSDVVWYTAQAMGELGRLNTSTGKTYHIPLGQGSAPHGVIVGPDGAPWITDGGLNAIVRVDPITEDVKTFPLPDGNSPFAIPINIIT